MIHCNNCQKTKNSCICVPCFLKGNHQGHEVRITHSSNATCDCGDPILWSETGFCSDHPGPEPNPDLTQLDKDTRIKLMAISKAAFHYYLDFASFNKTFFLNVTEWLFRLVSLGDATRRCVCIAMRDSFEFIDLYIHCLNLDKTDSGKLLKFLGSLTNDNVFRQYFSMSFLRFLPKFIWINHRIALENTDNTAPPLVSINQLFGFTFHATTPSVLQKLIRDSEIDWPKIMNESLHLIIAYSFSQMSKKYNDNSRRFSSLYKVFNIFKSAFFVFGSENQDIIKFVENLAEIFISKEFSFPLTRAFGEKINDPKKTQDVIFSIYFDMFHFISKIASREIYTTKPLEILSHFFNSKTFQSIDKEYKTTKEKRNENIIKEDDKEQEMIPLKENHSINELVEDSIYYHSVLSPEVQFAQSFPTHILAFKCLNLKEGKKNLREYISDVSENADEFIRQWALLPLRWVAASDLSEYQLFVRNSQYTITALHSFKFKKNIKYKFAPIFSLLQNLLKVTNDVDDFLLMIISTYGFFEYECHNESVKTDENNQIDDNQRRLCLLSIFHFISCLVFDTLCSENNFFTMRRLAVISKLMKGNLSLDEIESIWYNTNEKYVDDLQSFASRVSSKTGTKFHLTDNSEWHPLLPYLSLTSIIPLIQEFIHKNPDSLINFPSLPQDNQHILFSPILWALEYHILTHKACKDYQIIHQLIFNVLIITSNNSENFYKSSSSSDFDSDDDSILYASDFIDLYSKLKKMKFEQFLKKKIIYNIKPKSASFNESFPEDNALSLVDLIINLGNIGLTVLERMNISNINKSSSESIIQNEERNEKNRERANKLKMQIMSNFKEKQKLFTSATTQFEEPAESVENVECSVCHVENKKDYFVFPALKYKSPLSSYLKWRFRNAKLVNNKEDQSEQNDFSDIPESFDLYTTVRICMHPIHSRCIQKSCFTCPTDRCPRNASLPIIAGVYNYQKITDDSFKKGITKFVTKTYYNDIKYAVFSFASDIEILEMRHRSNPGCLDNVTTAATLRNIYLCIWHAMHDKAQNTLTEEEFKRRRKLVFNAVKNELIKKSDESENDLTWSELREKLLKYCDLPEVDKTKSIDYNVRNIMSILLPLTNKNSKPESETKKDNRQTKLVDLILQSVLNESSEHNRNENSEYDDDDDDDLDGEAIDHELDLQIMLNHEEDNENSQDAEYEMYYDEIGRMARRKWIYLSPLMKYILFSMDADNESDSSVEINMESFIKGQLLSRFVTDNDREIKGETETEDDEDFFRDTDTINGLSTDYKMLQFLRCAAIFDHFARGHEITQKVKESNDNEDKKQSKNDEFIDWDAILSPSYLNSHYKIFQNKEKNEEEDEEEHVLPMFSFINVPQNFLDFIHPPFSAPILTSDEGNLSLCLLTGKIVLLPSQSHVASPDQMKLETFLKKKFNKSFDILLNLNGSGASLVVITSLEFNFIMPLQSFYVDKFGDKDIGIKRGSLLFVSDSKREEIIDNFLSGTWTNSFKWPEL